jgi:MFS family permease
MWWQAMWMEMLIVGWLGLELTDSAWWVSVLGFYRSVPLLLIGPWGTLVTDRFPRRHLLCVFQGMGAMAALLVLGAFINGTLTYAQLAVFSFFQGVVWALDWPTRRAIIPDLVGRDRVVDALVLENGIQNMTRILGPVSGGVALEFLGVGGGLALLAAMGLGSFLLLLGLTSPSRAPSVAGGFGEVVEATRQGWEFVRANRKIWGVFLITVFMNVWAFPYMNLLPVFARDILDQGPVGLGWLGAAHGMGATVGLFIVHLSRKWISNEWLFSAGSLLLSLGLIFFSMSTSYSLSLCLLFISGLGQAGFSIMQSSIILVESSDAMRSRAMGALVLAIGVGPFGRLQSGSMAEALTVSWAVGSMALAALLATLATMIFNRGFLQGKKKPV